MGYIINARKKNYIWFNGSFINPDKITKTSDNFLYKSGVFEIIRIYNNKIFKFKEHIERLFLSSKSLMMKIDFSKNELEQVCNKLVENNKTSNGYIRLLISLGNKDNIDITISCRERETGYFNNLIEKTPLKVNISPYIKSSPISYIYSAQATNLCVIDHLARKKAIASGFNDSIILDYNNFVTGTIKSNIFVVKKDIIYTPATKCCLNRITRQTVIDLAKKEGIEVKEANFLKEELAEADEAFTTSTLTEITPILSIENIIYIKNNITNFLYSKYHQLTQELT